MPSGLSINATTGTISGTPGSVQGPTPYIVTVTDGTGATATASLTITVQEDDTRVADSFAEEGGAFVARRMDRMLSSEPRGFRLDSRRRAQGIRELTARARDSDGFLRFSGAGVSGSGRWHGWIEGDFSRQTDATGAARTEGDFGLLSAGADYLLNENLALGLMVQADAARDLAQGISDISGRGWMAGPYLSGEIRPDLFFTARVAWGESRNSAALDIFRDGSPWFSGNFATSRTLVRAALYGVQQLRPDLTLSPEIDLAYMREHLAAYTVTDGISTVAVPGGLNELGRLTLSARLEGPLDLAGGSAVFFATPGLSWDFHRRGANRGGDTRATLELGLRTPAGAGWHGEAAIRYSGGNGVSAVGLRAMVDLRF